MNFLLLLVHILAGNFRRMVFILEDHDKLSSLFLPLSFSLSHKTRTHSLWMVCSVVLEVLL